MGQKSQTRQTGATKAIKYIRRATRKQYSAEEMIRLGAYRPGSDPRTDQAIKFHEPLEAFLCQDKEDGTDIGSGYAMLEQILGEGAQ